LQGGRLPGNYQIGITERGQRARRDIAGDFRVSPHLAAHRLRRVAEYAHERPPHSFTIRKPRLLRDGLDGMPAVLQQQFCRLEAEFLDSLRGRLARFGPECTRELAGAQMRRFRECFNSKIGVEISPRKRESGLNSVGFRLELEKGRELRLSASTTMMDHHLLRNRPSEFRTGIHFDHRKYQIHRRDHTRRRPYRAVDDEYSVFLYP
jgi:hypothetical protein